MENPHPQLKDEGTGINAKVGQHLEKMGTHGIGESIHY